MPRRQQATARKPTTARSAAEQTDASVETIREIIFGNQMKHYETRFEELEQKVSADMARLATELTDRSERLENFVRKELGKVGERLKSERTSRTEEGRKAKAQLQTVQKDLESKILELDEELAAEAEEIRGTIQQQSSQLVADIQKARDQLQARIETELRVLQTGKLARKDFAAMLTEIVVRLENEASPKKKR